MKEKSFKKTSKEVTDAASREEAREKANAQLREWYVSFIKLFREKFSTLSKEEKSCLDNTIDYSNPCQIEVFWIANPSMQLIIQFKLPNRKDGDVLINGPFIASEFLEKVNLILQEPRWNQTISKSFQVDLDSDHQYTYAEHLAEQLHEFTEYVKDSLFNSNDLLGSETRMRGDDKVQIQRYIGNIGEEKYEKRVGQIIKSLKIKAKQRKKEESEKNNLEKQTKNQITELTAMEWSGFAVRLFPLYVVGKKPRPTVSKLLHGGSRFDDMEKIFDLEIDGRIIIVNRDGLIFVKSENKAGAVRIFNVMMGLGILEGFTLFAVRELDLSDADYNRHDLTVTTQQRHLQTIRSYLKDLNHPKDFYLSYPVEEMSTDQLRSIIQKTFEINSNGKLTENIGLFAESFTHLKNGEYTQSFIMGWTVIERKYSDVWKTTLGKRGLNGKRYNKLINSGQWSFDHVVEALNLNNKIDDQKYNFLMELKKKRNKIIHRGEIGSYEDAKRCLDFITDILKNEISIISIKSS